MVLAQAMRRKVACVWRLGTSTPRSSLRQHSRLCVDEQRSPAETPAKYQDRLSHIRRAARFCDIRDRRRRLSAFRHFMGTIRMIFATSTEPKGY